MRFKTIERNQIIKSKSGITPELKKAIEELTSNKTMEITLENDKNAVKLYKYLHYKYLYNNPDCPFTIYKRKLIIYITRR